jgi:hypothetical protein
MKFVEDLVQSPDFLVLTVLPNLLPKDQLYLKGRISENKGLMKEIQNCVKFKIWFFFHGGNDEESCLLDYDDAVRFL